MFSRGNGKIAAILKAGKEQLPPEEYERLKSLVGQLQAYGLTPSINSELGQIMSRLNWQLPQEDSPEWAEALIECDRRFLGSEIRRMFYDMGYDAPRRGKKDMVKELYQLGQPQIVEIVDSYLTKEGEEETPELPPTSPQHHPGIEFGRE